MQRLVPIAFVVLLALGAGFGAGHQYALRRNPMAGVELPEGPPKSAKEAENAIEKAFETLDPVQRILELAQLVRAPDPEVAAAAREVLERPGRRPVGAAETVLLVRAWARVDPKPAVDWAFSRPTEKYRLPAIDAAVEEWAIRDPKAASWEITLRTAPGPGQSKETAEVANAAVVQGWFDSGEYEGLEVFLHSFGPSFDQQRAIAAYLARVIRHRGPQVAQDWAEALPDEDGPFKLAVFRQLASELALYDPALGVAWYEKHGDGPFGSSILKLVGTRWATQEPKQAIEWISQAPAGLERDRAIQAAFRQWWIHGPDGEAAAWIEGIGLDGVEPWLAPALVIYAPTLANESYERALEWALLVPEDRKESVVVSIARRWVEDDPEAAEAWMARSDLSEDAKQRARTKPRPGPGRAARKAARSVPAPAPERGAGDAGAVADEETEG